MTDERIEYFKEGYKKGLQEAWNEILKDVSSGYSGTELRLMIKSKLATVPQRVEAQEKLLMDKLGIIPGKGANELEDLIPGGSYLIKERSTDMSYTLFGYMMKEGHPGLCITRKTQNVIEKKYGIGGFSLIKLGKKESSDEMLSSALGMVSSSTGNLSRLFENIMEYLDKNQGAAILLDGIEYLVNQNEFTNVMKFIQRINDSLERYGAFLLITISPHSLKVTDMGTLEREMTDVIEVS